MNEIEENVIGKDLLDEFLLEVYRQYPESTYPEINKYIKKLFIIKSHTEISDDLFIFLVNIKISLMEN